MVKQKVQVVIMGKNVTVEIKPVHFGPKTYTIFGKQAAIYLFRKIDGKWSQVYGVPFNEVVFNATVAALEQLAHE